MSLEFLDRAAGQTTCDILSTAGYGLVGTAVPTLVAGGGGLVPLTLGALSLLAKNALCNETAVGGQLPEQGFEGCISVTGGVGRLLQGPAGALTPVTSPHSCENNIVRLLYREIGTGAQTGQWYAQAWYECQDGQTRSSGFFYASPNTEEAARAKFFGLEPIGDATCNGSADQPIQPMPPEVYTPREYTDPDTNCTYEVTFQSFVVPEKGQQATPVFKIQAKEPALRAAGGNVGGCNFAPVLYYPGPLGPGGGGPGGGSPGGPTTIPWDDDWDGPTPPTIPPWLSPLISALAGAGGFDDYSLPEGNREIYAPCDYKEDGTPETFSVNFPEENWSNRVLTSLNAIVDFQQQFKLWKQPVCAGAPPTPLTGDPVSINWVSDEYSPFGNDRIRKLFTYFDQANTSLVDTVAHWKDFTWDAGPVIVSCVGTPLGRPQVWAISVDEAKRVINHAAAIAGVDTTNAQWLVAPPKSSRYGLQGLMRVHRSADGVLGITKRDGPSGSPEGLI